MDIVNILSSTVSTVKKKILFSVGDYLGSLAASLINATGIQSWQQVGFVSRPRDANNEGCAESLTMRQGNTVHSIATRDLRDAKAYGILDAGDSMTYAIVDKEAFCGLICKSATGQVMIYAPTEIDGNGVAKGACVVCLDPMTGAISLINNKQFTIMIKGDSIVMASGNGSQVINLSNDGIQICGNISLLGSVNVGGKLNVAGDTTTAILTAAHIAGASVLASTTVDPQGGVLPGPIVLS